MDLTNLLPKTFRLESGAHKDPLHGMCINELVAFMAGEPHSDHPECQCPVIGKYMMALNDLMPDDQRQRLIPYWTRAIGSRSKKHERARAEHFAWAAIRKFTPDALTAVGLHEHAKRLIEARDFGEAAAAANAAAAYAAANAADNAAYAADNAAYAADNAAAYAAAYAAANAAANAANAAYAAANNWDGALAVLDEALAIGPSGAAVDIEQRVAALTKVLEPA